MVSGNEFIDKFIQEVQNDEEKKLVWFPYEKFKKVEYLDKGGFSTIYSALLNNYKVILKTLNNTSENLNEFLNEVLYYLFFNF